MKDRGENEREHSFSWLLTGRRVDVRNLDRGDWSVVVSKVGGLKIGLGVGVGGGGVGGGGGGGARGRKQGDVK
jgi:hypothetical protein